MSDQKIQVVVVKYPDRKYLMMRYVDPATGKQEARSTKTTDRGKAAKLRVRGDTFGYLQRSFPTIVSESDAYEARECGRKAVEYALTAPQGLKSGSVAMKRVSEDPYQIEFFPTALANVARQTKPLPTEWVLNGNDVAAAYIKYARPLIGAMPKPGKLF